MKVKYKTTFHNTLKGCSLYPEKMLVVEIDIPDNIINDRYEVVKYIELNTGHFVLDLLINEEESAESSRNEETTQVITPEMETLIFILKLIQNIIKPLEK